MLIRKETLTEQEVRNFLEEFENLLIFLHREEEAPNWDDIVDHFAQPIADSLPMFCKINELVSELVCDEQPVDEVVLKFSLKSDCDE